MLKLNVALFVTCILIGAACSQGRPGYELQLQEMLFRRSLAHASKSETCFLAVRDDQAAGHFSDPMPEIFLQLDDLDLKLLPNSAARMDTLSLPGALVDENGARGCRYIVFIRERMSPDRARVSYGRSCNSLNGHGTRLLVRHNRGEWQVEEILGDEVQ